MSSFQIVVRKIDNGYLAQGFVSPEEGDPSEFVVACKTFQDVTEEVVRIVERAAASEYIDTPAQAVSKSLYDNPDLPSSS